MWKADLKSISKLYLFQDLIRCFQLPLKQDLRSKFRSAIPRASIRLRPIFSVNKLINFTKGKGLFLSL